MLCILSEYDVECPEDLSKIFIFYMEKNYPLMFEHLITEIFEKNRLQSELWYEGEDRLIKVMVNLFITDHYNQLTDEKIKKSLIDIMGEMLDA